MLNCRRGKFSLVFVSIVGLFVSSAVSASAQMSVAQLAENKCSRCHSYALLQAKAGASEQDWIAIIDKMKNAGLAITPEEQASVAKYLAKKK